MSIKITINGIEICGEQGQTILEIAQKNGFDIPNLCKHPELAPYGACGLCLVEAVGIPKLLRACATVATDGMNLTLDSQRVVQARKIAMELLMSDHEGDCVGPCSLNCPAGTDCQGYVKQIALGRYTEAVKIIKQKIPLPASIGRVCPHPCEKACRRGNVEQPISIAQLKYFAADKDLAGAPYTPGVKPDTAKKVAVVGAGPAGLSAAYYLRQMGHSVTILEAMEKGGGMLRYGIPEYRLPKAIVDREIAEITKLGVNIVYGVKVGEDVTLQALRQVYDAVVLAIGAWKSMPMRLEGEKTTAGVVGGIDFLRQVSLYNAGKTNQVDIGKKVVVVGGGNTAMDACRTAVRLGAQKVYVVYRRTRAEMPAEDIEIKEAEEEGVEFKFLTNPAEIIAQDGVLKGLKLQVMQLGEPDASGRRSPVPVEGKFEYLEVDTAIIAIGQGLSIGGIEGVELNKKGNIVADEGTFMTSLEGVFAVGDAINKGAGIAIAAIGQADKAAVVIDSYLKGNIKPYVKPFVSETHPDKTDPKFATREKMPRAVMPERPAEQCKHDFLPVYLGLSDEVAQAEAKRCLECGCHDYQNCRLIRYANFAPINPQRLAGNKNIHGQDNSLICIERNNDKCILCGACVRACDELAGKSLLGLVGRGFKTVVKTVFDKPEIIEACADCHLCVDACPTGALKLLKK